MHDGSLDCCGTCWFNSIFLKKERKKDNVKVGICTIRDFVIYNPFGMYCINHPNYNQNKIEVPLGSVFVNDGYGKPQRRKILYDPIDNETIRLWLLDFLDKIPNESQLYQTNIEEEVIKQLSVFKEKRAIMGLLRIINLNIESVKQEKKVILNKAILIGISINAIMQISDGEQLDKVEKFISKGIENYDAQKYNEKNDYFAAIRYHLIHGLRYCKGKKVMKLLKKAQTDPHREVRIITTAMLKKGKDNMY
jgi:hypothetical protein